MHMGITCIVKAGLAFHAIGLWNELIEGKPQHHRHFWVVAINKFALAVVGIQIEILIQQIDFICKHIDFFNCLHITDKLSREHLHVQDLRA